MIDAVANRIFPLFSLPWDWKKKMSDGDFSYFFRCPNLEKKEGTINFYKLLTSNKAEQKKSLKLPRLAFLKIFPQILKKSETSCGYSHPQRN